MIRYGNGMLSVWPILIRTYGNVNTTLDKIILLSHTRGMPEKRIDLDATGKVVAENVLRLRTAQNLGHTELARRLEAVGRALPVLGLRRIEAGERRVDVDDLMALATVFNVSPVELLAPPLETGLTEVTAKGSMHVEELRNWLSPWTFAATQKIIDQLRAQLFWRGEMVDGDD